MFTRQHLRPATTLLLFAGILLSTSSCSSTDDSTRGVASVQPTTNAPSALHGTPSVTQVRATYIAQMQHWVDCLRTNGFDVTDPDAKGVVTFSTNFDKADPAVIRGQKACERFLVPVPPELEEADAPRLSTKELKRQQDFAKCMRDSGAPDYPDPGPKGFLEGSGVTWDQAAPGARRAERACLPKLGFGVVAGRG